MFICQDLMWNIIEYTPRSDLKDLSRASPIFDQEMYRMGIRIYNGKDLRSGNYTLIRLTSGPLHLLLSSDDYFLSYFDGTYVDKRMIGFTDDPTEYLWTRTTDKNVLFHNNLYKYIFYRYDPEKYDPECHILDTDEFIYYNVMSNEYGIDSIDLERRYACTIIQEMSRYISVYLEEFKVVYTGGHWVK